MQGRQRAHPLWLLKTQEASPGCSPLPTTRMSVKAMRCNRGRRCRASRSPLDYRGVATFTHQWIENTSDLRLPSTSGWSSEVQTLKDSSVCQQARIPCVATQTLAPNSHMDAQTNPFLFIIARSSQLLFSFLKNHQERRGRRKIGKSGGTQEATAS